MGQSTGDQHSAAVALGRLGGLKGGRARAAKLTPEERSAIASKAAIRRWRTSSDEIRRRWEAQTETAIRQLRHALDAVIDGEGNGDTMRLGEDIETLETMLDWWRVAARRESTPLTGALTSEEGE